MKIHLAPGIAYKIKNNQKEPVKEIQVSDCNCGMDCCTGKFILGTFEVSNYNETGQNATYKLYITTNGSGQNSGIFFKACYEVIVSGEVVEESCATIVSFG